jgi:hypothetical protein
MTSPLLLTPLTKFAYVALLFIAVLAVAVADVCLKRATLPGSLAHALRSPWTLAAVALYLMQVVPFVITSPALGPNSLNQAYGYKFRPRLHALAN